ncbi:tetratricopeptide repeat protein [Streptomyces melanogenes]|uniref:tetratricopeptide repeat protein n=1 Tax=Streptomyces melanogenes TaxID=67326 RepID=UPI00379DE1FE
MLDTPEAVFEALRENHDRPHGLQRTVTAEELVDAAEAFEKADVLVTALHELMSAYEFTGEHRKAPVAFARLLKLWESAPDAFSDWETHQLFWRFKWVATSLLQVPEVPLASIDQWISHMRDRYESAGHGLQPVAAMRYHVAVHTGSGVLDAYDLWATRPRTDLSDCEACETRHFASHLVTAGDDGAAMDIWQPVLDGASGCTEEPQMSQAKALLPLLRLGDADRARSHHLTGYRRVRGKAGMQHEVGLHLEFCAHSRNEGRGLEILAENRPLFEAGGAPLDHLGFLTGVEILLARLVEERHADTAVAGPPGRGWTAGELLAAVRSDADRLAAAFDARNGTTHIGDLRRGRLEQRPLLDEPLPLGLRASVARPPVPAGTSAPAPGTRELPQDFASLVNEARRLAAQGHPGDASLWAAIAERAGADAYTHDDRLGPEVRLRAELAEQRAYALAVGDERAQSRAALEEAAELFERAGMPWQALAARARSWAWTAVPRDPDRPGAAEQDAGGPLDSAAMWEGLDAVLRQAEHLIAAGTGSSAAGAAHGSPARLDTSAALEYLSILYFRTFAAHQEAAAQLPDIPEPVRERFEAFNGALRSAAEEHALLHQRAQARMLTADLAARSGEVPRAEAELRAALKDVEAAERPWHGSRARVRLAQLLLSQERHEEAVELLHQAVSGAIRYDDADFPLAPAYAMLGHAATHLGDTSGAVRHLSEAAARFDRGSEHNEAAEVRLQLADVLVRTGQRADAVAVLESVLAEEPAGSLDERILAQARLTLARGLRELEEFREAAEEFLRLADTIADWAEGEDRPLHTLVATEAAATLAMAGRWDAAGTAYERAVASHAEAPNPMPVVTMMCEFARLTVLSEGAEGLDTALRHLSEADGVRAAVAPDDAGFAAWHAAGSVHYRRARVLAEAERFTEALAEVEQAITAYEQGGKPGEASRAEAVRIAALIEGNGLRRFEAATSRLSAAAARCEQAGLAEAAQVLRGLREEFAGQRA